MTSSRLERIKGIICDGLGAIKDTAYPGTSTETYRTNIKTVRRGLIAGATSPGELPLACVDYSEWEIDTRPENRTDDFRVFDLIAVFHIHGYYGGSTQSVPGIVYTPAESVGHAFLHDVSRWLLWNAVTYRNDADADDKWMIDHRSFKFKTIIGDTNLNEGRFQITFAVKVNTTTPDLM